MHGRIKGWFQILKNRRKFTFFESMGPRLIAHYNRKYNPAEPMGDEWTELPLNYLIWIVCLSIWNEFGVKFGSSLPEDLEILCVERMLYCLDNPNVLCDTQIQWPIDVLRNVTPNGRVPGFRYAVY